MDVPWMIPVPVRRSSFEPLHDEHAELNVEVDLAAIAAFAIADGPAEPLLWCDLQTSGGMPRRLGSGRAGCYRGHYLKGVGRTMLAGNWRDPRDAYHGTGHMCASAAAREWWVTRWLDARGIGDAIVPCKGVLCRPLPPALAGFPVRALGATAAGAAPADRELAAVSVKPGGFARMSNLLWLLDHAAPDGGPLGLREFFRALHRYLGPMHDDDPTPASLVEQLDRSIARLVENFRAFFVHGVAWGSIHNNFTIDGRFLDLELPVALGRPVVGVIAREPPPADAPVARAFRYVFGLEVLDVLQQVALWLATTLGRLQTIADASTDATRRFALEFLAAARACCGPAHLLHDVDAQVELVVGWFTATCDPGTRTRQWLTRIVRAAAGREHGATLGIDRWHAAPVELARTEPGLQPRLWLPALPDTSASDLHEAAAFADRLRAVDAEVTVAGYLECLRRAP
ncbi:MAG TPA: hypothetical protein VG755_24440 [Nannocystaceae bacterium]|nr:hypothetical protein [Nannocystaceae bacterium]